MSSETTTNPQNPPEATLQPGQLVGGKYRVDGLLGKGGMAEVWAGTNERTGKRIALKAILRTVASSGDAVELFRREALAGSRVNHPNVVNVFDVIDHEGMTCIVMEMLEGEPLSVYLKRQGKLAVEEAITLLLPAMRGVAAANAEGVVHRDLKPQNIFICIGPDGRLVTTKVLDFGIAVMREKSVDGAEVTQLLSTHGTPAYMSPEHISGALDIDERADVYGFGVLLFEALTGQVPFSGDPGPALLVRILNEPAPKITSLLPDLPQAMVDIVERAMSKDARDRFQTINDFIRAIEDCFLPASPLPRSLTPMAGVPLFALNEQKSGGFTDSVVRIRSEDSGLNESNATRQLFSLPRDGDSQPVPSARREVVQSSGPSTAEMQFDLSLGSRLKRIFLKRGVAPATFAGVVLFVGYLAFPRAHKGRPEAPPPRPVAAAPAQPSPQPTSVAALPPSPAVAPGTSAPASAVPPAASPGAGPAMAPVVAAPQAGASDVVSPRALPDEAQGKPGALSEPSKHKEAPPIRGEKLGRGHPHPGPAVRAVVPGTVPASESAVLVPPVPRPSPRSTSPAPRAGALSPDDFN